MSATKFPPFYFVVDDVGWIVRAARAGVQLVQLRLKDRSAENAREQIAQALKCCAAHGMQLVVNDHWVL